MGYAVITYRDHESEICSATIPGPDLSAANIDSQYSEITGIMNALGDVLLGQLQTQTVIAKVVNTGSGKASDEEAQRECKALVRCHDDTNYKRFSFEMPTVDLTTFATPGRFYIAGGTGHSVAWGSVVTAIEDDTTFLSPWQNGIVVDEIIHVGRNL